MTLQAYRDAYYEYSGKASDIARQLGFAGIAVIWLFKTNGAEDGYYTLDSDLFRAGFLIVVALSLDLLQYVVSAAIWGIFTRHIEKRGGKTTRMGQAPIYLNWPGLFFFWTKLAAVLVAYAVLLRFLWCHVA